MGHRESLPVSAFDELLRGASRRIFRVEALPEYNVPADRALYEKFLRGVPLPPLSCSTTMQWFGSIKGHSERGVSFQRLRLMPEKVTPYLRYEIDWCYTYSKDFGEETRFHPLSATNQAIQSDFYVVDDSKLIHIEYGPAGAWVGFSSEKDSTYAKQLIAGSSALWDGATKLEEFLASYRSTSV
jgi:hypothetical protein